MIRTADHPASSPRPTTDCDYDVIVVGGSIAGGGTAIALLRKDPSLKVLVVERQEQFQRRVGESTVELSTYFLTRVLGLTRHLIENHIVKQGFRYWFTNPSAQTMGCCTEMGGRYLTRVGSYQVDRAVLDEEILRRAQALGAEVWRPASVKSIQLNEGGPQELVIKRGDESPRSLTARWVVDASGRQAMIARQRGEIESVPGHPTASVWARFRNTLDFDSPQLVEEIPALGNHFYGTRHTATNHIMGDGWWAWVIPLRDGQTSVGVVWDQRIFHWPREAGGSLGEQLRAVLNTHPVGRKLLADAEMVDGDVHIRRNLPYFTKTPAGDGFILVGDALGFIDPFYSMGLDNLTMTCLSGIELIVAERRGEPFDQKLAKHNDTFTKSIRNWYQGIFQDKYLYMGDFELMKVAFLVEIGLYYFGLIAPPYQRGRKTILDGMFYSPAAQPFFWFMRWVNRRLAAIAAVRRQRGTFGRRNVGQRMLIPGFAFDISIAKATGKALWALLKLEIRDGWRNWNPKRDAYGSIVPATNAPETQSLTPTPPDAALPAAAS